MIRLRYEERSRVRFVSLRTGETMLELKMLEGSLITWGCMKRDRCDVRLDAGAVTIAGELADNRGPVLRAGDDALEYLAGVRVEFGTVQEEPQRDRSLDGGHLRREAPR